MKAHLYCNGALWKEWETNDPTETIRIPKMTESGVGQVVYRLEGHTETDAYYMHEKELTPAEVKALFYGKMR